MDAKYEFTRLVTRDWETENREANTCIAPEARRLLATRLSVMPRAALVTPRLCHLRCAGAILKIAPIDPSFKKLK
jgi:hypothetical protein